MMITHHITCWLEAVIGDNKYPSHFLYDTNPRSGMINTHHITCWLEAVIVAIGDDAHIRHT
jgi:hypothetical protein